MGSRATGSMSPPTAPPPTDVSLDTPSLEYETAPRARCVLSLALLVLSIPFSIMFAICHYIAALLAGWRPSASPVGEQAKMVLVTGGKMSKSLFHVRWLWKAGYKVVLLETEQYDVSGSRFSRGVHAFETIPCPRTDSEGYIAGLVRLAVKYKADFFLPVASPAAATWDAMAKPKLEAAGCTVLHFDLDVTQNLDDKYKSAQLAEQLGLTVPKSYLVHTEQEAHRLNQYLHKNNALGRKFILKNLEYDPIHRLDLFRLPCSTPALDEYLARVKADGNPIEPTRPWQLQQFIKGPEYTVYAVLREGQVKAMTTSASSASQLNYQHIEAPDIVQWVYNFAVKTELTGQLCFDFIRDSKTGVAYPIECNPRVHSQCSVFLETKEFGRALMDPEFSGCINGSSESKPVFWLYNELFKCLPDWLFHYGSPDKEFWARLVSERDADLDLDDPLPFFMRNHYQLPMLLARTMRSGNYWKKLDFCIGKVVQMGGD